MGAHIAWRVMLTVFVLAAATIAALALDAFEMAAPILPLKDPCSPHHGPLILGPPQQDLSSCQWGDAWPGLRTDPSPSDQRNRPWRDPPDGGPQRMGTDQVVKKARAGDGRQDPGAFTEAVVGFVLVNRQLLQWSVPTIEMTSHPGRVFD